MGNHEEIVKSLAPMFQWAEQEHLWFFSPYQSLWFSPSGLREAQARGNFLRGAVNWQLRNPRERVIELRDQGKQAFRQAESLEAEIGRPLK